MASVFLDQVCVDFPVYYGRQRSLRGTLLHWKIGGVLSRDLDNQFMVRSLDHVTVQFHDGDRIGLIGDNGAGKSTLIRIIAGILEPTSGEFTCQGSLASILTLATILDGEMTGYENINRALVLLGVAKNRWSHLLNDIEQFTELGDFLSLPIKTYSSGMQLRLSFALMTLHQPDIVLLDEVFAAGDATFRDKAKARLEKITNNCGILVVAHHAMAEIQRLCNKVLWLERGKVHRFGSTESVVAEYLATRRQVPSE
ncbi:MAG: ABC transporter ATP-binding protein [Magnetococcales bacterium]|nr:ABC transporter ATP-binding protein [Magnetococcales bacterium]MBF0115388.1 ABC transporter ATP-binding protein [Magnetococcales bacterium]